MKNNYLDIQDLRKIIYQTIEQELQKNHLECDILPVTILEFYQKLLLSKEYSLWEKMFYSSFPFNSVGFCHSSRQEIVIFLNRFMQIKDANLCLFNLLFVCYHEMRHLYQDYTFSIDTLDGYLKYIEYNIRIFDFNDDYNNNHDKYSSEIGANLYGIHKAKEAFLKNYPDQFDKIKDTYKDLENKFIVDYFSYDPMDTINRYVLMMQLRYKEAQSIFSRDKSFNLPNSVTNIFLRDDYTCKSLIEIIQHPNFSFIEKKLIYSFITSDVFLKSISLEELSAEERILFNEAISYAKTFYQNQKNTLMQYDITHFSQNQNLRTIFKDFDLLITGKENDFRSEKKQRKHLENIFYFEKKIRK